MNIGKFSINIGMGRWFSSRELVEACYQTLLGRAAESDDVLRQRARQALTARQIIDSFIHSPEYKEYQVDRSILDDNLRQEKLSIDVDVSDAVRDRLFARVQDEWTRLGESEPHWSVLTANEFRADVFQDHADDFFDTGKLQVTDLRRTASRNGIDIDAYQSCVDFGCGVGRITLPLADLFAQVHGVDVSPGNLGLCAEYARTSGKKNINTILLDTIAALDTVPQCDVLFSLIVLQHNPPPIQVHMLRTLLAKVNPGGLAYFQIPTYLPDYTFVAERYLEQDLMGMEMHAVPMHKVFGTLRDAGFDLLEVMQDNYTGIGASHRFCAIKRA
ncbi:methyltransferase domain-containing protein [uncultured Tateyamaria sp.]|uniref:class I SAM-dependent methyltransferase n=1 Tax=uncultured Tateyamaria sp. TaxID=455651 RepID=UPI002622F85C|nr:methyltransferase domain-containing protein [uncultured Tateyamaria sp.]